MIPVPAAAVRNIKSVVADNMEVKIIRSSDRKKTVSGRIIDNIMQINAPSDFPQEELDKIIEKFKTRFERRKRKKELNSKIDLREIAERLNQKCFNGEIKLESIEYSTNQDRIFGICNHRTRVVRISHRLASMPEWVRDYVIVHELAHLIEPNHSEPFWKLASRYEFTERARGYLMAKGFQEETDLEGNCRG